MSRPPQVLYVTYDGLLEPLGASQVLPYVLALAGLGFGIEVLSFEKGNDLVRTDGGEALSRLLASRGVAWRAVKYHKRPSIPATGWDVLVGRRFAATWARRLGGRPGLVHARGYLPALMGRAAQGRGARLLFDMRGFWVDERIEAGYWTPSGLPARLGRSAERALLRDADHLILLTRRAGGRLPSLASGRPVPPWTVVPTCVDLEAFTPPSDEERTAARRRLGLGAGPVLIHTGTLTGWYEGERTMDVARAFVDRCGGEFVILTRDVAAAKHLAAAAGIAARILSVPSSEVPTWLQAADAGLALVRCLPSKEASFPTKVGEYLAAGLAALSTPVGDLEDLEDPAALRLLRPGEDVAPAAQWLADVVAAPGRPQAARRLAEAHLGLEAGVEALAGVYRGLGVEPDA